jgi:hypothetical protein
MGKQEMSCPHCERITYCEDCMLILENMKNGIWPEQEQS